MIATMRKRAVALAATAAIAGGASLLVPQAASACSMTRTEWTVNRDECNEAAGTSAGNSSSGSRLVCTSNAGTWTALIFGVTYKVVKYEWSGCAPREELEMSEF
jgi:hypothetical protein